MQYKTHTHTHTVTHTRTHYIRQHKILTKGMKRDTCLPRYPTKGLNNFDKPVGEYSLGHTDEL